MKKKENVLMTQRIITLENLSEFRIFLENDEKSKATIEKYMRDISRFRNYLDKKEIEKSDVLEYKADLLKHYAVKSANSMLAAINSFFKFLGWLELCVKQYKVQKEAYCPDEKELTKEEYISLIQAAEQKQNARLSLVIQTICGTGIRISELKYITVEAVQKGEANVSCKGKIRKIIIPNALKSKLIKYIKENSIQHGEIFVTKSGKSLNRGNIWRDMKQLCESAGVSPTKVFPHNLRHLFARTFYRIEKDIAKLADILGHSNINTTRIYIMTTGKEHREKIERMCLIL